MVFWTEQEPGNKLLPRGSKGNFLGAAMAAAQMSFPGCHRVWHTEKKRLIIVSDVRSLQVKLSHDVASLPRPAMKTPRSVRRRTTTKRRKEGFYRTSAGSAVPSATPSPAQVELVGCPPPQFLRKR